MKTNKKPRLQTIEDTWLGRVNPDFGSGTAHRDHILAVFLTAESENLKFLHCHFTIGGNKYSR